MAKRLKYVLALYEFKNGSKNGGRSVQSKRCRLIPFVAVAQNARCCCISALSAMFALFTAYCKVG